MARVWGGPDYGAETEMGEVAPIVFDGSAEDATQRLHNRRPHAERNRIAILVRRARQQRNSGRTKEMNESIHEIAVLGIRSIQVEPRPAVERLSVLRRVVAWLRGAR